MKNRLHLLRTENSTQCAVCGKARHECVEELVTDRDEHWQRASNNCVKYGKQYRAVAELTKPKEKRVSKRRIFNYEVR